MNITKNHISSIIFNKNYRQIPKTKTNLNQNLKSDGFSNSHQKIIERNIIDCDTDISVWKNKLFSSIEKLNCHDLIDQINSGSEFKATDEIFDIIKTAIIKSARLNNKKITKLLLNYYQENFPNKKLIGFNNPLYHAICANDLAMVSFLVDEGFYYNEIPDYDIVFAHDLVPLNKAAAFGNLTIVKKLLSKELNINDVAYNYKNPLFMATRHGHIKVMEALLKKGARANIFIAEKSPLYEAAFRGNLPAVELLLAYGADPNCRFYGKGTAIYIAAKNGHDDVVKALLKKTASGVAGDPNSISSGADTPIYAAVENDDLQTARVLLEAGADPNAMTTGEDTPWSLAKKHGNEKMMLLLLKKLCDI